MRSEALLVIRLLLLLLTVVNATKASSSSSSSRSNRAPVLPASIRLVQQQKQHYDLLSKDKVAVTVKDPYETTTTTTTTTASQQPSTTCPSSSVAIARGGGGKSSALSTTTTTANAFRTRVLSAALMLSGLVAIVHYGGNAGVIQLILCIQVAMYHEVTSVMGLCNDGAVAGGAAWTKWWWFLTYFCTITVKLIFPLNIKSTLTNFIGFGMAVDGIVALVVQQNRQGAQSFGKALGNLAGYNVAALTMIGLSTFWILTIQQYGMKWIAYPFALVAINDTMAYVFGVLFGKHPLLAQISPKKTWEGFIGAAVSTMGLSVPLWGLMFGPTSATATTTATSIHLPHVIALAAYVSLVAPFGGFLASIVKRTYGHKDFGNLIPGHGGIVDRLDCQLMVAPLVYLGLQHFGTAAAS